VEILVCQLEYTPKRDMICDDWYEE